MLGRGNGVGGGGVDDEAAILHRQVTRQTQRWIVTICDINSTQHAQRGWKSKERRSCRLVAHY